MKKGLSLAFLIILIHLHLSGATSWKVNGNYNGCDDGGATVEDCLIGNDLEAEFSLGSHAARMLSIDLSKFTTGKTGNSNDAAVNCPHNQNYRSCLASSNGGGPRKGCRGEYSRDC